MRHGPRPHAEPVDNLSYPKYLMGDAKDVTTQKNPGVHPKKADIIGYWRLVDAEGDPAKDEVGFQNGLYKSAGAKAISVAGEDDSESAPGIFLVGQPSLVKSDPMSTCRFFIGGHVVIPFKSGLYSTAFTIEAWVEAQWTPGTQVRAHVVRRRWILQSGVRSDARVSRIHACRSTPRAGGMPRCSPTSVRCFPASCP